MDTNDAVLECRATGHRWPQRRLENRTVGEIDCCFRCGTTRTVTVGTDETKGYRYRFPAGYAPLDEP